MTTPLGSSPTPRVARRFTSFAASRAGAVILDLIIDLTAPVVLAALASHELLYNSAPWLQWVMSFVLIWSLVLRRRMPLVVFAVDLALVLALSAGGAAGVADFALLVALYSVAAHRKFRWALACAVLLEAGVFLVAPRLAPSGSIDDAVIILTGLAAAALFLGTTLQGRRGYLATVEDRAARLEIEKSQQAEIAALAERARIARELHDIVAHGLSVVITLAEGAVATAETDPARSKAAMQQVAAGGRESMAEMRRLLDVLRSDDTATRSPQPGLAALPQLVDDVRSTGLEVHLAITGRTDDLGDAAAATLYRIIQESLTNVIKHAPHATTVDIAIDLEPGLARFRVEDDGGPVPSAADDRARAGNGLRGMVERVAMFGGSIDASPSGTGWRVVGDLQEA